jgi:DNA-binding transcriptional MerR regulator
VQQVRDLDRLGVLPQSTRRSNNYRVFDPIHVTALRAYRQLAVAVGPVVARQTMAQLWTLPRDRALASVSAHHVALAHARSQALAALDALAYVLNDAARDAEPTLDDSMTITELGQALGVPSSTLRFWEHERLLAPDRDPVHGSRRYSPEAATSARVISALRAGGYRIPAIRDVISSLNTRAGLSGAETALRDRLRLIADQTAALLRAGDAIAQLVTANDAAPPPPRHVSEPRTETGPPETRL